jgi:AraC-like DNA-binding protein
MKYQSLNIHLQPLTSHFIENAFMFQSEATPEEYFLLSDGTVGLCIVLNGEGYHIYENYREKLPRTFLHGIIKKKLRNLISPNYKIIGIRFRPEFFQLIFKARISDFTSYATSLSDLIPCREEEALYEKLSSAGTETAIINVLNDFLKQKLSLENIDTRVSYCLNEIRNGKAKNVEQLSNEVNISSTSLRTLFRQHVGVTPKELIKNYRLQNALKARMQNEEKLTQLAYTLGYYDQSHFIHEFKEAIGISPLKYFSNQKLTYDFYNFQRWRKDSFAV